MNMHKTIAALIAASALQATALHAQSNLFSVQFRATCAPSSGRGNSSSMRNTDLMRQCVGTGFSNRQLQRDFALVFNSDADSIQVVSRTNGESVCDVFQFQGGTVVTNGNRLERLTFVFVPGQSDSVGSAVLRERSTGDDITNVNRARISARIQFTMMELLNTNDNSAAQIAASASTDTSTNNATDGSSSDNSGVAPVMFVAAAADVPATNSNVQVCSGTFNVGRRFSMTEAQNTGETSTNAVTGEIQGSTNANTGTTGTATSTTTAVITTNSTSVVNSIMSTIPTIPGI